MGMYCNQCQETVKNTACTAKGVCGKNESTSNLHDLLIFLLQGISYYAEKTGNKERKYGLFLCQSLFATIANANFDDDKIEKIIRQAFVLRGELKAKAGNDNNAPDCAVWKERQRKNSRRKRFLQGF